MLLAPECPGESDLQGEGVVLVLGEPQVAHFTAKGVRGTFVLFQPEKDRYSIFNEVRAKHRYLPTSTFKIPNALIGLAAASRGFEPG